VANGTPDQIVVRGTLDQLAALPGIGGFDMQDHGQIVLDDGRIEVVGLTDPADTASVLDSIQTLCPGAEVVATSAAQLDATSEPQPGQ
jgi:hypothetical protein